MKLSSSNEVLYRWQRGTGTAADIPLGIAVDDAQNAYISGKSVAPSPIPTKAVPTALSSR